MNRSPNDTLVYNVRVVTPSWGEPKTGSKGFLVRVEPDGRGEWFASIWDRTNGMEPLGSPLPCKRPEDAEGAVRRHLATVHPDCRFRFEPFNEDEPEPGSPGQC